MQSPAADERELEAAAERKGRLSEQGRDFFSRFITLRWGPLTAALLSLPLSAAAIFLSIQQPDVLLVMADQIRVAQGRDTGSAYVYLQPAFVSTGKNERVEVIREMKLEVTPPSGGPVIFEWTEQVRLSTAPGGLLNTEHLDDAVPLVVSANNAVAPLCIYDAPDGFFFGPGTYRFRLVADRVVAGQPLIGEFSVSISAQEIQQLDAADIFLVYSID